MGYSQNGAAFFYWAHKRRKKADRTRRVASKGSQFSDGMVLFLFVTICGLIGAAVHALNYAMFHISDFFESALLLIPFI